MIESKIARPIDQRKARVRAFSPYQYFRYAVSMDSLPFPLSLRSVRPSASKPYALNADESARFLRIISDSLSIERHYHLFLWLRGDLQEFLPHDILISAWGDFAAWNLKLDITSALPGVRTEQLAHCSIDELIGALHAQWAAGGRAPLVLKSADVVPLLGDCTCPVHRTLREMHSLLVHGVRDARGGHDSLYVALTRGSLTRGHSKDHFLLQVDSLIAQIDSAFRRVAAFPLAGRARNASDGVDCLELSAREQEILDWICQGKTNVDIAAALDISPFTVKNHLQRIFRKIGVSNRTEAATTYSRALRQLTDRLRG